MKKRKSGKQPAEGAEVLSVQRPVSSPEPGAQDVMTDLEAEDVTEVDVGSAAAGPDASGMKSGDGEGDVAAAVDASSEPSSEPSSEASSEPSSEPSSEASSEASSDALSDALSGGSLEGATGVGVTEAAVAESPPTPPVEGSRLESILESLLFAADRPLSLADLKRMLGERDGKRVAEAVEIVRVRHEESGIQLVSVAGGWQLRTHPANGAWVAKLVAGRPPRLSRAMMETLSIVAYRQPITRPEIDEIRGVDCGPVLRTLLDRGLIRIIGKKEEVGRPMLYGTTPEFLKTFSLRDLAELPTLREFHELGAEDRAKVDATASEGRDGDPSATAGLAGLPIPGSLPPVDPDEEDSLIDELDQATVAAGNASRSFLEPETHAEAAPASSETGEG